MRNKVVYIDKTPYEVSKVCKALDIDYAAVYHIIKKHKQTAEETLLKVSDKVYTDLYGNLRLVEPVNIEPLRVKLHCELLGLNRNIVYGYMFRHKCTFEEAVQMSQRDTIKKISDDNGFDYTKFMSFKQRNKGLNNEQLIEAYKKNIAKNKQIEDEKSFLKEACLKYGINFKNAYNHHIKHPELSLNDIIKYYTDKSLTDKSLYSKLKDACIKHELNFNTIYGYSKSHKDLTVEQIINYYLDKRTREESLYSLCIKNELTPCVVKKYKDEHASLTDEQVISIQLQKKNKKQQKKEQQKKNKEMIAEKCKELDVSEKTLYEFKIKHKELSWEQVIEIYRNRKEKREQQALVREMCNELNIAPNKVYIYKRQHPELSWEQVIEYYKDKINKKLVEENNEQNIIHSTLAYKCKDLEIPMGTIYKYKRKHPELCLEQIIEYYKNKKKDKEQIVLVADECRKLGISESTVYAYKKRHPELNYEQIIEYYKKKEKRILIVNACEELSIPTNTMYAYKKRHPELSCEQVVEIYKNGEQNNRTIDTSLRQKCKRLGLNHKTVYSYKTRHPELTEEQVLEYYKEKLLNNTV